MQSDITLKVREIIAGHFGVAPQSVTDDARFRDDLGADWLDRLELIIVIEDKVSGFELADVVADHIETVGDLIRAIAAASGRCAGAKNQTMIDEWTGRTPERSF